MTDYASKAYLQPDSHAARLERAMKYLGRKWTAHKSSTFAHSPEPRVLTAFQRKRELERLARSKGNGRA